MKHELEEWEELRRAQQDILDRLEDVKYKIEQCQCLHRMANLTDRRFIEEMQDAYGQLLLEKKTDGLNGYLEEAQFAREVEECLARRGDT